MSCACRSSEQRSTCAYVVTDDDARIEALLATPWDPGLEGKGVLISLGADPELRTWRTELGGSPHHTVAINKLGIGDDVVRAYLAIGTDGTFTLWPPPGEPEENELVEQIGALDDRLHQESGWIFNP